MRDINLRYCEETYDEQGVLTDFKVKCPDTFNFGYDVVDDIAQNDPDRRAMMWCNPEGEEHLFTFADMKRWSDKTANYLAAHGVGKGDMVMVILRRHYQFWFVATALAKLGAVMVPATFMLKEHDLEYRLNGAVHQGRHLHLRRHHRAGGGQRDRSVPLGRAPVPGQRRGRRLDRAGREWQLAWPSTARWARCFPAPRACAPCPGSARVGTTSTPACATPMQGFSRVETHVGDPMLMYFSSGTSGNPKMVLHDSDYALAHLVTAKHWHNVQARWAASDHCRHRTGARRFGASITASGLWRPACSRTISIASTATRF